MSIAARFVSRISRSVPSNGKLGIGFNQRRFMMVLTCAEQELVNDSDSGKNQRFVAAWGNGDYGRLGLGSLESKWRPALCSAFGDGSLREIACGGVHTLFLIDDGNVYASGLNDHGQLGVSDGRGYTIDPLEVSGLPNNIVNFSAGYYHSSAITEDEELYMWGKNSSGQLGLGKRYFALLIEKEDRNFVPHTHQTWNLEKCDGNKFPSFDYQIHHGMESLIPIPLESTNQTRPWSLSYNNFIS